MNSFKAFQQFMTQANKRPIGIFDSGVGGLSIAKCIRQTLANEDLLYVADNQFSPYGKLSTDEIIERVNIISFKLIEAGAKAIVTACNTATVNAIDQLRAKTSVPIIGVEPAIKPAAKMSQTQDVGLLVTQSTALNPRFLSLVEQHKGQSRVHIQPCPELAGLIEQGHANSEKASQLLRQYLLPLIDENVDTIVLGCTHYPFVSEVIQQICGDGVQLVETAEPVTKELQRQLFSRNLNNAHGGSIKFYATNANEQQEKIMSRLWQQDINLLSLVNIC